jgi:hypothetical protein
MLAICRSVAMLALPAPMLHPEYLTLSWCTGQCVVSVCSIACIVLTDQVCFKMRCCLIAHKSPHNCEAEMLFEWSIKQSIRSHETGGLAGMLCIARAWLTTHSNILAACWSASHHIHAVLFRGNTCMTSCRCTGSPCLALLLLGWCRRLGTSLAALGLLLLLLLLLLQCWHGSGSTLAGGSSQQRLVVECVQGLAGELCQVWQGGPCCEGHAGCN